MPKPSRRMDTVFVMITFCVFSASVLMVLMLGGNIYKKTEQLTTEGYDERTCLSYIWAKVKNSDETGRVRVGDFCGLPVLYLEDEYEGTLYNTMIYAYDGWARELFSESGLEFSPEDGMLVARIEELTFEELDDGLISVNGGKLIIFPRGRTVIK